MSDHIKARILEHAMGFLNGSRLARTLNAWLYERGDMTPGEQFDEPLSDADAADLAARLDRAQWRRVEDGLPGDSQTRELLCRMPDDPFADTVTYHAVLTFHHGMWWETWGECDATPTHWRPLPEGPE